jgi:hypothetical protein
MAKKKTSQKKEIIWNIVNSLLSGLLILLGAFTTGEITSESIFIAIVTALVVAVTQFKNYWTKEESEYSVKLFKFI